MAATNENFRKFCEASLTAGGASPSQIANAESSLGVVFPKSYRAFLEEFGAMIANGFEVFGIIESEKNSPPMWQQVVDVTSQLRRLGQVGTERSHLVPISEDGLGVYFFLNTNCSGNGEVLAIGLGVDEVIAEDLESFAVRMNSGDMQY